MLQLSTTLSPQIDDRAVVNNAASAVNSAGIAGQPAIRFPTLENTLRFLVAAGIDIGTVLDVGVHTESAPLKAIFTQKKHILFEPVSECHTRIEKNYANIDYELIKIAVSDYDGVGYLNKYSIDETGEIFCELMKNMGKSEMIQIPTSRLDSFCQQRRMVKPYLLRIAVDGHEMPILQGAQEMLKDVAILIVDAYPSNLDRYLNFIKTEGFSLFDIVDNTYYYGTLQRFDLVFLKDSLADRLAPPPGPVAEEQWVCVAYFDPNRDPADAGQ